MNHDDERDYAEEAANARELRAEQDDDQDGMPEPCQPIGCDNGIHRPGCWYAELDRDDQGDQGSPRSIRDMEQDLIAAKGDPARHAAIRQEIRAAGFSELAAELDRIAAEPVDPVDQLDQLGAVWSPDFDAYAGGQLDAAAVRCVLCGHAPCDCPPFGSPEYLANIDRVHGRGRGRS